MSTIVFVHAHPDDESSSTSGTIALAAAEGHRVVVVYATNGDHGEVPTDLEPGETLVDRRRREAHASCALLGVSRVVWLNYRDSGMTGWDGNEHEESFMQADPVEARGRLLAVVDDERADVLVGYDWHGNYGHPDHVAVHRLVRAAADAAMVRPRLLEVTINRDAVRVMIAAAREMGVVEDVFDPDGPMDDGNPMGTPEAELHWAVDISDVLFLKRMSLRCHASQASDIDGFLAMPPDVFEAWFAMEHYIEPGREPGMVRDWPF